MARTRRDEAIAENKARDLARDEAIEENAHYDAIAENKARGRAKLIKYIIILAVLAAAALSYIYFVPQTYRIIFAAFSFLIGYFLVPKNARPIVLIMALAFVLILLWPAISKAPAYASQFYTQLKTGGIGQTATCALDPGKCFGESWKSTGTGQINQQNSIDANWQAVTINPSKIVIPVVVTGTVESTLETAVQCFNDKGDLTTNPPLLIFEKSGKNVQPVTCTGAMTDKIGIRMKSSASSNVSAYISIGKTGTPNTPVLAAGKGAYNIEISSTALQPFSISTPITIKLKPAYGFNLTQIKSLDIIVTGSLFDISCPKMTGTSSELKDYLKGNNYEFICDLNILNLPEQAQNSGVEIRAAYDLVHEDKAALDLKTGKATKV